MTKKPGRQGGAAMWQQIVDAALATLKKDGFAGASSRAIARAGGFNQALIFYHFGSLDSLLLAALDQTSAERLARYRGAVDEAATLDELTSVLAAVYAGDRDTRHLKVISQMVAGSVARPELAPAVVAGRGPGIGLCEEAPAKGGAAPPAPL